MLPAMPLDGWANTFRGFKEGTPYAGGYFYIKFNFTEEFPAAPPKCASMFSIVEHDRC